ncbi:N-acetylmuramoyl-L-alanine amidase [Micromonosporaceae bacterium B7E4]
MTRLLWLPEVLRAAGLTVHEVSGWRTRGSDSWSPRGIICHETRGSKTSTDAGEIGVLLNGSATAPPPIAQLYLSRTGHWHVVASGRCNHVRTGWAGPFKGIGNSGLIGIEAQHALGEPWTDRQYDSYVRGVAALKRRTGWGIGGHKEHQPAGYGHSSTKTDPSFSMVQFRADVARSLAGEDDDMPLSDSDLSKIRSEAAKGLYDALHIAATGRDYRDLTYDGTGSIGASIRGNLTALTVAPVLAALAAADQVDERALAAELAPALAAAVVAALPEDRDDITVDELTEAFRRLIAPAGG